MSALAGDDRARIRSALADLLVRLDGAADDDAAVLAELRALVSALLDTLTTPPDDELAATEIRRVVHDMRSASGALLTWSHLLCRGLAGEHATRALDVIERTVRRQVALAERLAGSPAPAASAPGAAPSTAPATTTIAAAPAPRGDLGSGSRPSEATEEPDLTGLRVLIVDDDVGARESMRLILVARGAEVVTAVSAIDAFDVLQQGRPDLLISDIVMPDADGYALLRRVRAPDTGERGLIPAIAVTGRAEIGDRQRALGAGYQVHLTKPFEAGALLRAVRTVTGR